MKTTYGQMLDSNVLVEPTSTKINPLGKCNSYAVWKNGDFVFCTEEPDHVGAHRVEFGGPGAWWIVDIFKVDF